MIKITLGEIEKVTGGKLRSNNKSAIVKGFSTDSRSISPGDIFIAIKGDSFDGHDFVAKALESGAAGAIVSSESSLSKADHVLVVEDTVEAMGKIAAAIREKVDIPVVCITGTNGKTTVKEILSHILSKRLRVLKSEKSYNNIIGLSMTLFNLEPEHEAAVLEVGTNHPGEIIKLARIAQPHMAIITNIGDGHLEAFYDREGVFVEKITLLDVLPESGMAFLNKDDVLLARAAVHDVAVRYFGTREDTDFRISSIEPKAEGCEFLLNGNKYYLPLEGEHNVYNAAVAISVAEQFGMDFEEIKQALEDISLPKMRLERVSINGVTFINDSYNANPDSFESALDVLQRASVEGKRGVIAGDMMELGEKSSEFHRMIGKSIADRKLDFVITMGQRAWEITQGALEGGVDANCALRADDHEHAAEIVQQLAGPGATILVKGSRAMRMEEVLKCFTSFYTR